MCLLRFEPSPLWLENENYAAVWGSLPKETQKHGGPCFKHPPNFFPESAIQTPLLVCRSLGQWGDGEGELKREPEINLLWVYEVLGAADLRQPQGRERVWPP